MRWQLVARTGARPEDVLQLLMHGALRRADVGVVLAGVNDITKQVSLRAALRTRDEIAAVMQERARVRHVVFSALPEMEKFPALPQPLAWYAGHHARRYNDAQARLAGGAGGGAHAPMEGVMDPSLMAGDGFHPGADALCKGGPGSGRSHHSGGAAAPRPHPGDTMNLKGKTIFIITGASRGIGLAIALRAARDGANVAIAAKTTIPIRSCPARSTRRAAEIEAAGGRALPLQCDIREEDAGRAAVAQDRRDVRRHRHPGQQRQRDQPAPARSTRR